MLQRLNSLLSRDDPTAHGTVQAPSALDASDSSCADSTAAASRPLTQPRAPVFTDAAAVALLAPADMYDDQFKAAVEQVRISTCSTMWCPCAACFADCRFAGVLVYRRRFQVMAFSGHGLHMMPATCGALNLFPVVRS